MFQKFIKLCLLTFAITILPAVRVQALTTTVYNQEQLKKALQDSSITTITLGNDIETTEKINITRSVTIDGNGHTMKYVGTFGSSGSKDNTVWGGIYLLQVYQTEATIKNIKLTGGNAGLLVNGSKVTLVGTIDVSGNGFGGIELAQGSGVDRISHLILSDNAKIVNTTEDSNRPTLWVPNNSDPAILEKDGLQQTINSNQELSLEEITELFQSQENPSTGDFLFPYYICTILGILGVVIYFKKAIA